MVFWLCGEWWERDLVAHTPSTTRASQHCSTSIQNTNTEHASRFLELRVFQAAYSIILAISKTATRATRVLSVGTIGDMIKVSPHLIST